MSTVTVTGEAYVSGVYGEIEFRSVTTLTFDTDDDGTNDSDTNGAI